MKNLKKLGKVLGKKEQMSINGGKVHVHGNLPVCQEDEVLCEVNGNPSCCSTSGK